MATAPNPVQRLYDAFLAKDGVAMQACYAPDARFRDEVFDLHGDREVGGMWQMLLTKGKDLEVEVSGIRADDTTGAAHWEADYTFSATKRKVHNVIEASFVLRDGLIVDHVDQFDFWSWTRQALGPVGVVAGWTPMLRSKVQADARRSLETWLIRGV